MFREQKQESGWRTYDELVKHLPPRIQIFEQYFDFEVAATQKEIVEVEAK